jgi:predicted RNA methylase
MEDDQNIHLQCTYNGDGLSAEVRPAEDGRIYGMRFRDIPFVLRHSVANRGLIGSSTFLADKILQRMTRGSAAHAEAFLSHPFDAEFGTDTAGLIRAQELLDGHGRKSVYNTAFYATPPSLFQKALARLEVDFNGFTFVDLGAGKGRAILLASNYPFRQVIGVEYARELATVASRNISRYHPPFRLCQDVRCILGDACDFSLPPGPLVIFMWNPFVGLVFERVLTNLEASLQREPREVYVVYLRPNCAQRLDTSPWLKKLWECRLEMTEQDLAAYQFGARSELCVAYRSYFSARQVLP